MAQARRFSAALIAGAVSGLLLSAGAARAQAPCEQGIAVLPAPIAPWKGAPLRVLFVSEKPLDGELSLTGPDGGVAAKSAERSGGPPYFWYAEVATPAAGTWHVTLNASRAPAGCASISRDINVAATKPAAPASSAESVWPLRNSWNRDTENLYSAWIAKLFDAPLDVSLSWKAWNEVLRDQSRNMLFNYLGNNEDNLAMGLRPDCADFVYFLRAYFAFKMGLPFGYSNCSRGMAGRAPKCAQWFNVMHPESTRPPAPSEQDAAAAEPPPAATAPEPKPFGLFASSQPPPAPAPAATPAAAPKPKGRPNFGSYLRDVGDVVHTGAVRVAANDDNTDFYMMPLNQDTLRPGTVYADPYGHVLVLVKRLPEVNGAPGIFLAVDAEPDGSITRKKFWRGNFLFVHDPALGSPADRARAKRLAPADQRRDRQEPAIWRFFPGADPDQRRGFL